MMVNKCTSPVLLRMNNGQRLFIAAPKHVFYDLKTGNRTGEIIQRITNRKPKMIRASQWAIRSSGT